MSVHLFGIRHHGVGSTRSLLAALEDLQPDCLLIEGPPDADDLLPLTTDVAMRPPVALLVYDVQQPRRAAWYPFTVFSPEWQAIRTAQGRGIPVRFMDLPMKHVLALDAADEPSEDDDEPESPDPPESPLDRRDPLTLLARMAGESDGERWWNRVVEEVVNPTDVFAAVHEAMCELRRDHREATERAAQREALREAWMRKTIREAERLHERVAVVCGAWHTPALADRSDAKADTALLRGLPSIKVTATFSPWTYGRIAGSSGYGAGVVSPGWYHHIWESEPGELAAAWLTRVASLLRREGLLASTAQVIDGVRLTEALSALRDRPGVGLDELNDATLAVLCAGHREPLALIQKRLIVGERMGEVPESAPAVPLARDLEARRRKLRLTLEPEERTLALDLRKETDRDRSRVFHQLQLLSVPWAEPAEPWVRGRGTFHESWTLMWTPELGIKLIEQSVWGNTVESAAIAYAQHVAETTTRLSVVTELLERATKANLAAMIGLLVQRVRALSAAHQDIGDLLQAIPPLLQTLRYGDVRRTDAGLLEPVLEELVIRASLELPSACRAINDDLAEELLPKIEQCSAALWLAERPELEERWTGCLRALLSDGGAHPLLAGLSARLLLRRQELSAEEVAHSLQRAFSIGNEPSHAARWLEGLLTNMEQALLRNDALVTLIDQWVVSLEAEQFEAALPLVRRTFSTFSSPARRTLAERIKRGERTVATMEIDQARADRALPLLRLMLGVAE